MRRIASLATLTLLAALIAPTAPATAASYQDVAARELTTPALVMPRDGVLEAYTVGVDQTLQQQVRNAAGAWAPVQSLGGRITSAPAAVSMAPGRVDVFARGGSGQLLQRYAVNGVWSGWRHLGGSIVGAPSVVSWAPGRLDVFARSADSSLVHLWFTAGQWLGWERLGGVLASAPSAVTMVPGRLDIFVRGSDGQLWQKYYAGRWSGWAGLGGVLHSQPAVVTTGDGRLDVLVRGGEGDLRLKSYVRGRGWSDYSRLGGPVTSGPGAVVTSAGEVLVAARDERAQYVLRSRSASGSWSGWTSFRSAPFFDELGAWVDLYDYQEDTATLSMTAALDDMRARGVRTLYLQTSRFSVPYDIAPLAPRWVDAAHARGIAVVGWYLPGYGDMARDLRRTLAVARLVTPAGGGFDGVGVDIEAHTGWGGGKNEVSRTTMNARSVEHLKQVRAQTRVPLAAITPQPTATDGVGETWEGFPWRDVGPQVDVVLPMSYWPKTCRDACVRDYTLTNARYAASWAGRPVHIAGRGYPSGDSLVSDSDVRAFVDGAVEAGVIGGSLYDYASTRTRTSWWPILARLNAL